MTELFFPPLLCRMTWFKLSNWIDRTRALIPFVEQLNLINSLWVYKERFKHSYGDGKNTWSLIQQTLMVLLRHLHFYIDTIALHTLLLLLLRKLPTVFLTTLNTHKFILVAHRLCCLWHMDVWLLLQLKLREVAFCRISMVLLSKNFMCWLQAFIVFVFRLCYLHWSFTTYSTLTI